MVVHPGKTERAMCGGMIDRERDDPRTRGVLGSDGNAEAGGDNLRRVSSPDSWVAVWVVTAQEDRMIAVHVGQMEAAQQ